jgi:hypothetical protein
MPIETPEDLRRHVETAIRIELSTIPPYLFTLYSIEDLESSAALLIRSIVAEEMLHAALTTNLLLALGGTPRFGGTGYIPSYPMDLPHHRPPLRLDLAPCSLENIRNVFMRIEQPEERGAPPETDEYETLGQFYNALEVGLEALSTEYDLFADPQPASQMSDPSHYRPVRFDAEDSGGLLLIEDLDSAVEAIEIIIHQGEGMSLDRWADPAHQELTHYHKLVAIESGAEPLGAVRPLRRNPRAADYPGPIRVVADLFNALYRGVFLTLDRVFRDDPEQARAVGILYLVMGDLMSQTAHFLVGHQLEDGSFAAPTFEAFDFSAEDPIEVVQSLAEEAATRFPSLTSVRDGIEALELIL